ncbi:hypothetical protein J4E91_001262 [Alternaria rosae]|nr:hypothetical protein J4E91_001262 [Alternaria rosae]
MMGWVGGEEPWNDRWHECFGEVYTWRAFEFLSNFPKPATSTVTEDAAGTSISNATPIPSDSGGVCASNIWHQFKGFVPDPAASFKNEF